MEVDFDDEPIIISIKGDPAANLMVKAEEVPSNEAAPSLNHKTYPCYIIYTCETAT